MGERNRGRLFFRLPRRLLAWPGERRRSDDADGQRSRGYGEGQSQRVRVGPNDQSLLPTKLIGVTSTIAIAWATISGRPISTSM